MSLVVTRRRGQAVLIGPSITVRVTSIDARGNVRLAIDAPPDVRIRRPEIPPTDRDTAPADGGIVGLIFLGYLGVIPCGAALAYLLYLQAPGLGVLVGAVGAVALVLEVRARWRAAIERSEGILDGDGLPEIDELDDLADEDRELAHLELVESADQQQPVTVWRGPGMHRAR
jgi:carbon storage regulator CsrA